MMIAGLYAIYIELYLYLEYPMCLGSSPGAKQEFETNGSALLPRLQADDPIFANHTSYPRSTDQQYVTLG